MGIEGVSTCAAGGIFAVAGAVAIIVSGMGLAGAVSIKTVSVTSLVTGVFNPVSIIPQVVVGILGLTGSATMGVVSGVTLGFAAISFMVGCCCSSSGVIQTAN